MAVQMNQLLQMMVDKGGSDLHLSVGRPPTIRLKGRLRSLNTPALTPEDTFGLVKEIAQERQLTELDEVGGSDFGIAFGDKARFRVSIFKQKQVVGCVLRLIPNELLTFEQLGIPAVAKKLCDRPRGLVLVTGPTGSGKTTSLATMLDYINQEHDHHIITIEDPIEYYHSHKKSIISQREIGVDVPSFAEGLRRALRMDPDVILVGEMRDLETIGAAITAAETGHLVFGTLHTTGAARTVDRIIDAFPTNQQEMVRVQLSQAVIGVISQSLMPTADGKGRIAAFEIMVMTDGIANMIRDSKTYQIPSSIQTGHKHGMILLDDFLFNLYQEGKITYEDMMAKSQNPDDLNVKIKEHASAAAAGDRRRK